MQSLVSILDVEIKHLALEKVSAKKRVAFVEEVHVFDQLVVLVLLEQFELVGVQLQIGLYVDAPELLHVYEEVLAVSIRTRSRRLSFLAHSFPHASDFLFQLSHTHHLELSGASFGPLFLTYL